MKVVERNGARFAVEEEIHLRRVIKHDDARGFSEHWVLHHNCDAVTIEVADYVAERYGIDVRDHGFRVVNFADPNVTVI